jgi:hypothetical protein
MSISDDDAEKLVNFIESKVREETSEQEKAGILNIINQWRSDIEVGRQVERKVVVRQSPGLDTLAEVPRSRSATSGDFVGREDYEPTEQLNMLIGALGVAYLAPQMMAQRFIQAIEDFGGTGDEQKVVPDVRFVGVGEFGGFEEDDLGKISRANIEQSRGKTDALSSLLDEISNEAEIPQRKFSEHLDPS